MQVVFETGALVDVTQLVHRNVYGWRPPTETDGILEAIELGFPSGIAAIVFVNHPRARSYRRIAIGRDELEWKPFLVRGMQVGQTIQHVRADRGMSKEPFDLPELFRDSGRKRLGRTALGMADYDRFMLLLFGQSSGPSERNWKKKVTQILQCAHAIKTSTFRCGDHVPGRWLRGQKSSSQ